MTQEVQPLTWQKRTNIEEHQQFFAKINEIIANLAPTVNEAEAAIAQATQAIASANAAVSTANAASANADAASQQAQTAAGTVAGYDGRMAAVESKNTQQDAAITALQTADGQDVKISGNQNITGIKTVPTEATGTRSQQIANSAKVGAELDNYSPMVRTTGNQEISGNKKFSSPVYHTSNIPIDSDGVYREAFIEYTTGTNNDVIGAVKYSNGYKTARRQDSVFNKVGENTYSATLRLEITPDGTVKLVLLKGINGTETSIIVATM